MLYLAFFLLRDGVLLSRRIRAGRAAGPPQHRQQLAVKFITVIRATVKGNVLVAATQGTLGGLAFWFLGIEGALLWAVLMGFLSLLPAIGAGTDLAAGGDLFSRHRRDLAGRVAGGLRRAGHRPGGQRAAPHPGRQGHADARLPGCSFPTIGGMSVFGISGFVIGPVIAAMFMAVWDLFAAAREEAAGSTCGACRS